MEQYIFKQDYSTSNIIPKGSVLPLRRIDFKKGEIIEGNYIVDSTQSESNYVDANSVNGRVNIPFGGRTSPLEKYVVRQPVNLKTNEDKRITYNVGAIGGIVILGIIGLSIYGGLKLAKLI